VASFNGCDVAVLIFIEFLCGFVVVEETKWENKSSGHIIPKYNSLKRKVAMET
jgi:hypothetical protein